MYTLLLVDDDLAILDMLTMALAGPGVRVLTAQTVSEAEYAIAYFPLNAAILDVHLTTANQREGLDVLEHLRREQPGVEVIVMSGSSEPNLRDRALRAGAWTFLRKPVGLAELERHLNHLGYPAARWGHPGDRPAQARAAFEAAQPRSAAV